MFDRRLLEMPWVLSPGAATSRLPLAQRRGLEVVEVDLFEGRQLVGSLGDFFVIPLQQTPRDVMFARIETARTFTVAPRESSTGLRSEPTPDRPTPR